MWVPKVKSEMEKSGSGSGSSSSSSSSSSSRGSSRREEGGAGGGVLRLSWGTANVERSVLRSSWGPRVSLSDVSPFPTCLPSRCIFHFSSSSAYYLLLILPLFFFFSSSFLLLLLRLLLLFFFFLFFFWGRRRLALAPRPAGPGQQRRAPSAPHGPTMRPARLCRGERPAHLTAPLCARPASPLAVPPPRQAVLWFNIRGHGVPTTDWLKHGEGKA